MYEYGTWLLIAMPRPPSMILSIYCVNLDSYCFDYWLRGGMITE